MKKESKTLPSIINLPQKVKLVIDIDSLFSTFKETKTVDDILNEIRFINHRDMDWCDYNTFTVEAKNLSSYFLEGGCNNFFYSLVDKKQQYVYTIDMEICIARSDLLNGKDKNSIEIDNLEAAAELFLKECTDICELFGFYSSNGDFIIEVADGEIQANENYFICVKSKVYMNPKETTKFKKTVNKRTVICANRRTKVEISDIYSVYRSFSSGSYCTHIKIWEAFDQNVFGVDNHERDDYFVYLIKDYILNPNKFTFKPCNDEDDNKKFLFVGKNINTENIAKEACFNVVDGHLQEKEGMTFGSLLGYIYDLADEKDVKEFVDFVKASPRDREIEFEFSNIRYKILPDRDTVEDCSAKIMRREIKDIKKQMEKIISFFSYAETVVNEIDLTNTSVDVYIKEKTWKYLKENPLEHIQNDDDFAVAAAILVNSDNNANNFD